MRLEEKHTGRKVRAPCNKGVCTSPENFKIYGVGNAISELNTKENAVRGQGRPHFFRFEYFPAYNLIKLICY